VRDPIIFISSLNLTEFGNNRFLISAFFLDFLTWGLVFSFSPWEAYLNQLPGPLVESGNPITYAAVGTTSLALIYSLTLPGILLCGRYPKFVAAGMRISLCVYAISLLIASFASNVAMLIIFQGVIAGAAGGLTWSPSYYYLNEWYVLPHCAVCSLILRLTCFQ
jgi:MFS family permease